MPTLSTHVPDDWRFADKFSAKIQSEYQNKPARYLRDLVERDLAGAAHEPTAPTIVEDLCRTLRPDKVSELSIHLSKISQPALLARLIDALPSYLPRDRGALPLYLLTGREAAALAMSAAARQDHDAAALMTAVAPDISAMIEGGSVISLAPAVPPGGVAIVGDESVRLGKQRPEASAITRATAKHAADPRRKKTGT